MDTFLLSYRNTLHCARGQASPFLLFSRIVTDKLLTVPSTERKMKTYTDTKQWAKQTDLKAEDDVSVKHTGAKEKLQVIGQIICLL